MSFSTTSYLAGVGSVIAALTIGFSGGFFLAKPTPYVEQNRLQRVTSNSTNSTVASPAPQATDLPQPVVTEAKATPVSIPPEIRKPSETVPVMAEAVAPETAPVIAKPEPIRDAAEPDRAAQPDVKAERLRAADAKAMERKRKEARKFAERRRQREIALATVAVRRMLRDRDPQQVADSVETPRFGFFGQE